MKKLTVFSFVLALAFTLTACGAQVQSMTIAQSLALEQSKTAQLTPEYKFDKELAGEALTAALAKLAPTYATSDEAVATVDEAGLVTAVDGGKATITMTLGKDITAQCAVTVTVPVQSVAADSSLALTLNGEQSGDINARVVPSNATDAQLSYESSDESVATMDSTGKVTAVANGECIITAACDGKTAQTKVTVTTKATGIALDGTAGWIYIGGGHTLKPYTVPAEAPASTYTYASGNAKVATVNEKGLITGKAAGSATITVTSADGFTTQYAITVKTKPAPVVKKAKAQSTGNAGSNSNASAGTPAPAPEAAPPPAPEPAPAPAPATPSGGGDVGGYVPVTPGDGTGGGMAGGD